MSPRPVVRRASTLDGRRARRRRASVMASSAAETCAEVLLAGSRGAGGASARARAVALAEEVGHAGTVVSSRATCAMVSVCAS